MALVIFLFAFVTMGHVLADEAAIQFDYIGTGNGVAELKANCRKPKGKTKALLCEFTEVRALPLENQKEETTLSSISLEYKIQQLTKNAGKKPAPNFVSLDELPLEKKRALWAEQFASIMKETPDRLTEMKEEECRGEPRDYYDFRGAYNETFDAFLAETKKIGQKLCLAKDPESFAKATQERWELVRSTCELHYGRYQLWLYEDNGVWSHEGKPEGAFRFTSCFSQMRTEMRCDEKKVCQITRTYTPEKMSPTASRLMPRCPKDSKLVTLTFSKNLPRRLPESCKYVLDRERSSQCCAYQK